MSELNIARQILEARHQKKVTQEELASYIGVSKAAVSKWESGISFPDITILPQLATYFNISIDELMGYEPQMTKEEIKKTYRDLKKLFAEQSWDEAMKVCEELEKKYYSCFPLLLQLIVLYLNHGNLSSDPPKVYEHCIKLAERIRMQGEDVNNSKQAVSLEVTCHLLMGEPMKALDLLGEKVRPYAQDTELLGQIYQSIGNVEKTKETFQLAAYQHLMFLVGDATSLILAYADEPERADEIIKRTLQVVETYKMDTLHPNAAAVFYLTAAQVYCMNEKVGDSLAVLEKYVYLCEHSFFPFTLHGDEFFDRLDEWFQEFDLGGQAPRSEILIKKSMLESVKKNPALALLQDKKEYKSMIKRLERLLD